MYILPICSCLTYYVMQFYFLLGMMNFHLEKCRGYPLLDYFIINQNLQVGNIIILNLLTNLSCKKVQ